MLVSHRSRFIFTKVPKTAGTSVESYFDKFCMEDGLWAPMDDRPEHISEAGIVSGRAPRKRQATWYPHMPAARIRDLVGEEVWAGYFKFTVVRDPFDKLISGFYHGRKVREQQRRAKLHHRALEVLRPRQEPTLEDDIAAFRSWVPTQKNHDRDKYVIGGRFCVDDVIRYENLQEGIERICRALSLPYEPSRLPAFKSGIRRDGASVARFFDRETIRFVCDLYDWEMERFGYRPPA